MEKYKVVACAVILCFHVRESLSRNLNDDEAVHDVARERRNVEEWNNEKCVCFPTTETGKRVSKLFPSHERLVVYFYRNQQSNKLTAFIPGQKKQDRFPDLQFDMRDKIVSNVPERTIEFFNNARHSVRKMDPQIFEDEDDDITSSHNMRVYTEAPSGNNDPDTLAESPDELTISLVSDNIPSGTNPDYSDPFYFMNIPSADNTVVSSNEPSFNLNNLMKSLGKPGELTIPSDGNNIPSGLKPQYSDQFNVMDISSAISNTTDTFASSNEPSFNLNNLVESPGRPGELTIPPDGNTVSTGVKPSFDRDFMGHNHPKKPMVPKGYNVPSDKPQSTNQFYVVDIPSYALISPDTAYEITSDKPIFNPNTLVKYPSNEINIPDDSQIVLSNGKSKYSEQLPMDEIILQNQNNFGPTKRFNIQNKDTPDLLKDIYKDILSVTKGDPSLLTPIPLLNSTNLNFTFNIPDTVHAKNKTNERFNKQNKDMPDLLKEIYKYILSVTKDDPSLLTPIPLLNGTNLNFTFNIPDTADAKNKSNERFDKQNKDMPDLLKEIYKYILSVTKGNPSLLTPIPLLSGYNLNFLFNTPGTVNAKNKTNDRKNAVPSFQKGVKYLPEYIESVQPESNNVVSASGIEIKDQNRPTDFVNIGFLQGTYTHPKFNGWFNEQMKTIRLNKTSISNAVNLNSFKLLLIKALYDNGIQLSRDGHMYDSKGNHIKMSHLQLRPILLGDPMDYEKLIKSGKCVIPYSIPYLEAVLVTLVYPPRILAIIPLGYRNALNSKSHGSLIPSIFDVSRSGLSEVEDEDMFKDQNKDDINVSKRKPINEYKLIDSDKGKSKNDHILTTERDLNMDPKKDNSLDLNIQSPESAMPMKEENKDNVPTTEMISEIEEKEPNPTPNNEENGSNILISDGSNDIEEAEPLEDSKKDPTQTPDEEESLIIRIIGGNPATSSGTPVSSRGRSGIAE